uniref:Uncharacterized protein n=1 Tax=Rhizobium rhizogenes TaxID=359 RepID=A0A7S5DQS0_RHIRH|nr:hypothetical protein pC5.7c_557 [Rhizobium rhizogenes]QCL09593.1 hypothetical protein pC5.8a_101 [Rhizobium rhizogenes]
MMAILAYVNLAGAVFELPAYRSAAPRRFLRKSRMAVLKGIEPEAS